MSKMWVLRRVLLPMGVTDAMEFLLDKLKYSKTNSDFFDSMGQSSSSGSNEGGGRDGGSPPVQRATIARRSSSSGATNSNTDKD
jgi:hypothetical protein